MMTSWKFHDPSKDASLIERCVKFVLQPGGVADDKVRCSSKSRDVFNTASLNDQYVVYIFSQELMYVDSQLVTAVPGR